MKLATKTLVDFVNGLSELDKHYMDLVMDDLCKEWGSGVVSIETIIELMARKKEAMS